MSEQGNKTSISFGCAECGAPIGGEISSINIKYPIIKSYKNVEDMGDIDDYKDNVIYFHYPDGSGESFEYDPDGKEVKG